ncbi:hypothetical protein CLAFUR0_14698 [Fulvia fulva]|nr:hypothetical protein CLAFUR0_14698 [Fulvia fulva]
MRFLDSLRRICARLYMPDLLAELQTIFHIFDLNRATMIHRSSLLATALALTVTVVAQSIQCDCKARPNWGDCYTLIEPYLVNPGTFPAPGKGKGSCSTFTFPDNSLNCQVELCPDEDIPIRTSRVQLAYSILMATCDPNGAGGTYITPDPDGFRFTAELNPDFAVEPPSAVAFNATQGTHAKDIFKRQQDSVTSFERAATYKRITRPGSIYDVGPVIPGGGSITKTVETSETHSVSAGVSFSAGVKEIFSAGASVEVMDSYTVSNAMGVEVTLNCPANARKGR